MFVLELIYRYYLAVTSEENSELIDRYIVYNAFIVGVFKVIICVFSVKQKVV